MGALFLVGMGGFLGSAFRFLLSGWVQSASRQYGFPVGTLAVNVLGCTLIGVASQLMDSRSILTPEGRSFAVVGILGGFTTFSTFGNETLNLIRTGEMWLAGANVAGNVGLGLLSVWMGRILAQLVWR